MPDDAEATSQLTLSGSGSTRVSTDEMFAHEQAIALLDPGLSQVAAALRIAQHATDGLLLDASASLAQAEITEAIEAARSASGHAEFLWTRLDAAMQAYGEAELRNQRLLEDGAALLALVGGAGLGGLALALGPLGTAGALLLPGALRSRVDGSGEPVGSADMAAGPTSTLLLSDPAVVMAIRLAVSSGNEFVIGLGGMPAGLQALVSQAAGVDGVQNTAMLLSAYASLGGMLRETPVTVTRTRTEASTPTAGFVDRLGNIPDPGTSPGNAQIRIDQIRRAGEADRYEVFVGGTVDFSAVPAKDAFDLSSNVTGVGGLPSGSLRAVEQAMRDAGISSTDRVVFTGYSQGGLVAASLASSDRWNTAGVVTVGAPAGNIALPGGIPAVIVEHEEDLVTALGGVQTNTEALVVRRQAFASAAEVPLDLAVPGHQRQYYLETAALMDDARSEQLRTAAAELDAFSADRSVTSTYYYASRTTG